MRPGVYLFPASRDFASASPPSRPSDSALRATKRLGIHLPPASPQRAHQQPPEKTPHPWLPSQPIAQANTYPASFRTPSQATRRRGNPLRATGRLGIHLPRRSPCRLPIAPSSDTRSLFPPFRNQAPRYSLTLGRSTARTPAASRGNTSPWLPSQPIAQANTYSPPFRDLPSRLPPRNIPVHATRCPGVYLPCTSRPTFSVSPPSRTSDSAHAQPGD